MISRKSRGSRKKPVRSRESRGIQRPKTHKIASKRSLSVERQMRHTANSAMRMTDLQKMAKSLGIPFGGKSKDRLIRDINKYH